MTPSTVLRAARERKRHRWADGDTCLDCGLRREGAGAGRYGSRRYYFDDRVGYDYKAPPCVVAERQERGE